MITVLNMNPCLDRTVVVDGFRYGKTNLVCQTREDASGKGINVALVLQALGNATQCVAPCPADGGTLLRERLKNNGVALREVPAEGRLRCNIKLLDRSCGTFTELNERGTVLDKKSMELLYNKVLESAAQSDMVVLSGSLPPGVPADFYKQLIQALSGAVPVVLDTSGAPLQEGIQARPRMIKPNLDEFSQLFGREYQTREAIAGDAKALNRLGIPVVCVSLGEKGAILAYEGETLYAPPLPLEVRGVQGAGDSLVAGLCHAVLKGAGPDKMLQSGVAAACGSLVREGTQLCRLEDFQKYLPLVQIYKI